LLTVKQLAVVLLVALCATPSADAQPAEVKARYLHFLNQHVFGGMNEKQCDSVIRKRGITQGDTNNCKETNTFILATQQQVRAVCQEGGTHKPNTRDLYESTKPFPVITCSLQSGDRQPKCKYRGQRSTRHITVGCAQTWPVHYDGDDLII
uniref:Ribonuclease like 3 n=1 Tax=Astyanax mexicanus TaxID=7994 RepID=A0A8B9KGH3_ASTMX